ncbi:response regulator [Massilia sp. NEAU-DD11]|uniref:histidine kinase n=1 Tax=Massilia cellulosiltytica TaxID=2683234 RepID=A0A7X3K5Y4_9BURK|nr:ATP-binding protein [Telluria cellulosilytica]MVW59359.1 response regulator [Telluria cellulosilytica]
MRAQRGPSLSLRHLLVVLTATGLLPLAALGAWSVHLAAEYHQGEQERALLDLARALSSAVDAELDGTVATLASIARTPALGAGNVRAFYPVARDQARAQPEWLGVILADGDGNMVFRTTAPFDAPPQPVADPSSLRQALLLRRPVIGHVARGKGGRAAVPVRFPVSDAAGHPYVLTAVVQPDRIMRALARQQVPPGSVISVLDGDGAIVARSHGQGDHVGGPPSPSLARLIRLNGPESAGATVTLEGNAVTTAYTRLSRYGWTVAVGAPPAGWAGGPGFAWYGAGIALSLALSIGLATLLARRIVRRIATLAAGAAALGAGTDPVVPTSRIEEIDAMGAALRAAGARRAAHERDREDALELARQAGRAKDEFLAVLGHELRNPLAPIAGALDLMDLRDDAASRRERGIMRRQVAHLKHLVDDLLDVSRIASGKLRIDVAPVDLAAVVRHAVAARPDQPLRLQAPAALWIAGDEHRLAQVLGNLLSNAARFGSTDTHVVLERLGGEARLVVADNGVGMDTALAQRVFEPFYQAPQPLVHHSGLGLGLAIVQRIVELHGGRVSAHSDGPGLGSRFEIVLPLGAPPPATAPAPIRAASRPLRVLVVDDNEDAAALTAAILRELGHEVKTAHTANAALDVQAAWPPDVAILDIGLPDMDGYALAAAMRRAAVKPLRLTALTGYGRQAGVAAHAPPDDAAFDLHLTKPASLDDLRRALDANDADASSDPAPA